MVLPNFKEVTLNFFVAGHSQSENDSIQSKIESASKQKKIFTTDQWQTISMSFKKNTPNAEVFNYTSVDNFKDSSVMPQLSPMRKNNKIDEGEMLEKNWTKIMVMKRCKDKPGNLQIQLH